MAKKKDSDLKFKLGNLNVVITDKPLSVKKGANNSQIIGVGGKNYKTDKIAMMLVNEDKGKKKG